MCEHKELSPQSQQTLIRRVRFICAFFMAALILRGLTAIHIKWEVTCLNNFLGEGASGECLLSPLTRWVSYIRHGLDRMGPDQDFIFYLTDWLAFGYIFIGIAFLGPLRDPIKNVWVINWAITLFAAAFPIILISANSRNIPAFWQIFDLTCALLGLALLLLARKYIKRLQ